MRRLDASLAGIVLVLVTGCAGRLPPPQAADPARRATERSLLDSVAKVSGPSTNLGRMAAVERRAAELGLAQHLSREWIDWFSVQRNLRIDLPGESARTIYVVAHYDKVDLTPLAVASTLLNGALDPLIAPLYTSAGAVDNATGVSVTLELARWLGTQPRAYSYRLLLVGSEESGLRGSRAHLARLSPVERDAIELAIVIDTTGLRSIGNCVMSVSDPRYARLAQDAAAELDLPLGYGAMPRGASSDFEPFAQNSFTLDLARGLKFNLVGGLLPQRSWFTGAHRSPVLFFSACDLLGAADYLGGTVMLPLGRLHGPRDRLDEVDPTRLREQYAIARRLIEDLERALRPGGPAPGNADVR